MGAANDLSVGDTVTWTNVTRRGKSVTLSHREGELVDVGNGFVAVRQGKKYIVMPRADVRKKGETTALTEFAIGLAGREVE